MADFNALEALINAHIKKNGVQAITGNILNGILRGMVSALGKGYTIAGVAVPSSDPGTMTGPLAYLAYTAGTYTHFGGLEVGQGEVSMLIYNEAEWHKEVLFVLSATATVDDNVGTPEVGVSFVDGLLTFDFRNMKGNPGNDGDAAGFGTINATVDGNVGTPGVSVQSSGPDTAKNITFQFTNLKGETGVTSVVATVDNTVGTPTCTVSLVGQQLTLAFSGLKGAQGDTGSSVDYPFTIVNNLTTNDATQALSAAMGVQLEAEVSQLEAEKADKDMVRAYMMSDRAKNALLAVLDKVAFAVPDVSEEMEELNEALFNLDEVVGVEATYTQGTNIVWSDGVTTLDELKLNLVVKAVYGDGTKVPTNNYILSGSLTAGTSTITVTYLGEFIDTFDVVVTQYGSKMSYTMAEGTILNKPGRISDYSFGGENYCEGINNYESSSETTRRVFPINFGKIKMRKYDTLEMVDIYPIKIPTNATSVFATISGSNQQIAMRVLYLLPNGHYIWKGTDTTTYPGKTAAYATGSNSLDISAVAGRTDTYLLAWGQRVNSASYSGNEPTAITITFNE